MHNVFTHSFGLDNYLNLKSKWRVKPPHEDTFYSMSHDWSTKSQRLRVTTHRIRFPLNKICERVYVLNIYAGLAVVLHFYDHPAHLAV